MAVKLESEKTAVLRAGKPGFAPNHGKSAKFMGTQGAPSVGRKDSKPGRGKTMKSVGS